MTKQLKQICACVAVVLLFAAIATAESGEKPVRAHFVSCPACKLRRMPELRAFLKEVSREAPYGDAVTVQYKGGATPILHLYGENDKELSQIAVDNWTAAELHAVLESNGFKKAGGQAGDAAAE